MILAVTSEQHNTREWDPSAVEPTASKASLMRISLPFPTFAFARKPAVVVAEAES